MDQSTQPVLPVPTEAEREFWRRAVEAARRRPALPAESPDVDEDS